MPVPHVITELSRFDDEPQVTPLVREAARLVVRELPGSTLGDKITTIQDRLTLVAFNDGAVIAVGGLEIEGAGVAFLEDIAVASAHQGDGLGRSLIGRLEARAALAGIHTLNVIPRDNAQGFYEKLGYRLSRAGDLAISKTLR